MFVIYTSQPRTYITTKENEEKFILDKDLSSFSRSEIDAVGVTAFRFINNDGLNYVDVVEGI